MFASSLDLDSKWLKDLENAALVDHHDHPPAARLPLHRLLEDLGGDRLDGPRDLWLHRRVRKWVLSEYSRIYVEYKGYRIY